MLEADVALPLSLVIHELATNATKYGSLGSQQGRVEVQWKCDGRNVILDWTESGGPRVSAPTRRGFGSVLIERAFPSKARAETRLDYRPEGIAFQLIFFTGTECAIRRGITEFRR